MKTILSLAIAFNLITLSLQLQYVQDDVLAFPRYKVVLTHEKVSQSALADRDVEPAAKETRLVMTSSLGQPFSCTIPNVQITQERLEREKKERAQKETEQDKQNTIERGLKLLEPLESNCIRFLTSSHQYWAYEYCHNQYVRQFHVERTNDGKVEKEQETDSYILGYHPTSKSLDRHADQSKALKTKNTAFTELKSIGDQRYLVQTWRDGSLCDLTDKPRTVEVQYHCDIQGQDRVSSFVEVSTCNYQIVVSTPRLCEEMNLFRRHHTESHQIKCNPIVPEELIEQERHMLLEQSVEEPQQQPEQPEQPEQPGQLQVPQETDKTSQKETDKDLLLGMIFDLKDQISQLKDQLKNKHKEAEVAYFTMDEQGNLVPGVELSKLIGLESESKTMKKKQPVKEQKAQEQHQNKQAYHQKYIAMQA